MPEAMPPGVPPNPPPPVPNPVLEGLPPPKANDEDEVGADAAPPNVLELFPKPPKLVCD